jgi:hypothetical protein
LGWPTLSDWYPNFLFVLIQTGWTTREDRKTETPFKTRISGNEEPRYQVYLYEEASRSCCKQFLSDLFLTQFQKIKKLEDNLHFIGATQGKHTIFVDDVRQFPKYALIL